MGQSSSSRAPSSGSSLSHNSSNHRRRSSRSAVSSTFTVSSSSSSSPNLHNSFTQNVPPKPGSHLICPPKQSSHPLPSKLVSHCTSSTCSSSCSPQPGHAKMQVPSRPNPAPIDSEALYDAALSHYFNRDELPKLRAEDRRMRCEEGLDNYGVGGYHRVHRGQLYNARYLILSKLGWGHFSTVWLSADLHRDLDDPHRHVALKVQKGEPSYLEAALDEVKLLRRIRERSGSGTSAGPGAAPTNAAPGETHEFRVHSLRLAQMLDHFLVAGANGKHMCTVFEVLGENLLQLLKRSPVRRLPIHSVKRIARDVLLGLDYLHRKCQIIHTDLKPENVLVSSSNTSLSRSLAAGHGLVSSTSTSSAASSSSLSSSSLSSSSHKEGRSRTQSFAEILRDGSQPVVKIADLGNACWTDHHFTDYITTRQYRAPEIILKAPYSCGADMWSFACLVFELLTGEYLFDPKQNRKKGYSRNDDHLALMLELMGPAPPAMLRHAKSADHYFDAAGRLRRLPNLDYWPLHDLLQHKYKMDANTAQQIASFLRPLLQLDPEKRVSAREHLLHPWLRIDDNVDDDRDQMIISRPLSSASSSSRKSSRLKAVASRPKPAPIVVPNSAQPPPPPPQHQTTYRPHHMKTRSSTSSKTGAITSGAAAAAAAVAVAATTTPTAGNSNHHASSGSTYAVPVSNGHIRAHAVNHQPSPVVSSQAPSHWYGAGAHGSLGSKPPLSAAAVTSPRQVPIRNVLASSSNSSSSASKLRGPKRSPPHMYAAPNQPSFAQVPVSPVGYRSRQPQYQPQPHHHQYGDVAARSHSSDAAFGFSGAPVEGSSTACSSVYAAAQASPPNLHRPQHASPRDSVVLNVNMERSGTEMVRLMAQAAAHNSAQQPLPSLYTAAPAMYSFNASPAFGTSQPQHGQQQQQQQYQQQQPHQPAPLPHQTQQQQQHAPPPQSSAANSGTAFSAVSSGSTTSSVDGSRAGMQNIRVWRPTPVQRRVSVSGHGHEA